jgi:hypothetical protein
VADGARIQKTACLTRLLLAADHDTFDADDEVGRWVGSLVMTGCNRSGLDL